MDSSGFRIVSDIFSSADQRQLIDALGPVQGAGRRGLLHVPLVKETAFSSQILDLVRPHLPCEPVPVRAIYFDKSSGANWLVAWHQDLTLAVSTRVEIPGFGPWSVKDGVPHVQPPVQLLAQMLTVRLHLDDCDECNGALRIVPGSHRHGKLSPQRILELRAQEPGLVCSVPAGGVLLMRPLLLHASGRSQSGAHRRILHIEYAGFSLPDKLTWHEAA